jgi:hypothetical protein
MLATRWLLTSAAVPFFSTAAFAQWQNGDLALRTNGNLFRSGETLRVELVALGPLFGPFSVQVRYGLIEQVQVVDKDGNRSVQTRDRAVTRPPGPPIERLDPYQRLLLDDTLHFGEDSPEGCFRVDALVFLGGDPRPTTTLRSCVCVAESRDLPGSCTPYLRALREARSDDTLIFDGRFASEGLYSLVLISDRGVELHIPPGVTAATPDEMQVFSAALRGAKARAVDILIHDHRSERSTTLSRASLPIAPP